MIKKYDIKPIPCLYEGVTFRSSLEARWACFFDMCKIEWVYEPFAVGNWLPDFQVSKNGFTSLVEVKPSNEFFDLDKYELGLLRHQCVLLLTSKVQQSKLLCNLSNMQGVTTAYQELFPSNRLELWESARIESKSSIDNKRRYKL